MILFSVKLHIVQFPPIVDTSTKVVHFYHNPSNTMQPFTILPTYKNLTIEMVAGGGSGAFTNSYNGGAAGAGAGGYIKAYFHNNTSQELLCRAGGGAPLAIVDGDGSDGLGTSISFGVNALNCYGGEKGFRGAQESGNIHGRGGLGGETGNTPSFSAILTTVFGGDGTNANAGAINVMTSSCGSGGASFLEVVVEEG